MLVLTRACLLPAMAGYNCRYLDLKVMNDIWAEIDLVAARIKKK